MRVLGLDLSKDAVSCVEIETAFGRFEIRETYEAPLTLGTDSPDAAFSSAGILLSGIPGKPPRVVTSSPIEIGTFRNIQVATRDKKAIRSALAFELEDDLPFDSENLHYDFSTIPSTEPGSMIHVGAVKKDSFAHHLSSLISNGVDPDVVTTDAWAYRCLFTRTQKTPETSLLIGFERNRTFFYVNGLNRPILYREIPFGLSTIERKLEETMSPSHEELQTWMRDIGVSGADASVTDAILEVLELLVPEIKQTELAARSQVRDQIDQVYVTGEGALLPGFLNWLEDACQRRCSLFRPLSILSGSQVSYSDLSEARFSRALALAVSLIPADKAPVLNLRKGAFARFSTPSDSPLELIKKPLPYLLILLLVFFATKTIEYNYYKGKLSDTEENLKRTVKQYFNGISDSAARTYLADSSKLKKTVQSDLSKERELARLFAPNLNSPLDLLKMLSEKIGKDVVIDLVDFQAGADNTERYAENKSLKTSLSFLVSNPQTISKLSEILEKNFSMKRGNSEEITKEGRKIYRVVYSGVIGGAGK